MNRIHFSSWMIVTKESEARQSASILASPIRETVPLWTDDYSNLFRILK